MTDVLVLTHARPEETAGALTALVAAAADAGVKLRLDADELRKHGIAEGDGVAADGGVDDGVGLCIVLGGDGTILRALRRFAFSEVPVFAVNFGEIGFLATVEAGDAERGFERAFRGDFETLLLPAIELDVPSGRQSAMNDISIHRKVGERVARLSYAIEGDEVGSVRCDGLVVSTPAGSTGYNLANGGPVLAWGVEGFVVSFISPHSLTARALVVAPGDTLTIHNRSRDPVDVTVDGRPACELPAGDAISARFVHEAARLAQVPGSSFYRRLREKFGSLAS
jgi:NAD+ kinase